MLFVPYYATKRASRTHQVNPEITHYIVGLWMTHGAHNALNSNRLSRDRNTNCGKSYRPIKLIAAVLQPPRIAVSDARKILPKGIGTDLGAGLAEIFG